MEQAKKWQFFFQKLNSSKNVAIEEVNFFSKKVTEHWRDFQAEEKKGFPNKNGAAKKKGFQIKMEGQNNFFF